MDDADVWLYENRPNRRVTVHLGGCRACRHGAGEHGGGRRNTGAWTAGYASVDDARAAGSRKQPTVRMCKICLSGSRLRIEDGMEKPGQSESVYGQLDSAGWIGKDPSGQDAPFLLLAPRSGTRATANAMRLFAGALGLRHDVITTLYADAMTARLDASSVILETRGTLVAARPVNGEWQDVARAYGKVVLVVSAAAMPVPFAEPALDTYLARPGLHYLALIPMQTEAADE